MKIIYLISIPMVLMTCLGCSKESTQKNYLFQKLSVEQSGIDFINKIQEDPEHSIINYVNFYNGGGIAAGDVDNDGLTDLYFVSNQGDNKLYLNKGKLIFEDISDKANINGKSDWNTGVTMVDLNNDGFQDIYVCSVSGLLDFEGHNELFVNNGDGTFTERAKEYGLDFKGYSTQAYFFDYDKDNDLDVYIVNGSNHTSLSIGPAIQRNIRTPLIGDVLLQNNNGKFLDVSEEANIFGGVNGYGLSASIADFNKDGWDDIYVCNDFYEDDYYYINNQDGTFKESLSESFSTISRSSMGSDAADINGDGYQDLITLDMLPKDEKVLKESEGDDAMFNMSIQLAKLGYKDQYSRNMLQINNTGSYFHESALFNKMADSDWSWGPLIADYNNDGHQDIFIANGILRRPNDLDFQKYVSNSFKKYGSEKGLDWLYKSINEMPSGEVPNQIFQGNSVEFKDQSGKWIDDTPSLSNGAIYSDLDLDGDLDLVTNNLNNLAGIYENTTNDLKNYITLKFNFKEGNKEGIGTKACVYINNHKQLKQLFKSRGFLSSVNSNLHFGIDSLNKIDSIKIIWPDNTVEKIINPDINQVLTVNYSSNNNLHVYKKVTTNSIFSKETMIDFKHSEDSYNDFFTERLIPYRVSTLGPAMAFSDLDNNGFQDVFIGNSSGKNAVLYMNNGSKFIKTPIPSLEKDKIFEDNDAVFFDADNDGDKDLYIATGISFIKRRGFETDRLYINTNGAFERSSNKIPINYLNASCVKSYDYDSDGDEDLFVGNLSDPRSFGSDVESYILNNDGNGVFKKDKNFSLSAKVTSAIWNDINNDGTKDLLVSTEWGEPRIYFNNNGILEIKQIPENLNGLWQSLFSYDIDLDGDKDIILGNWGNNTRFNAYIEKPILMYYGDFDSNGTKETVLAYYVEGKYYPLNSKDELASQMNIIRDRFTNHKDFALQPIEKVLTPEVLKNSEKFEIHTLSSGYLVNNNGSFKEFKELPDSFQLAPINSFSEIEVNNENHLLVTGNSLKVNTYHGGYTSLKGILLKSITDYETLPNLGIEPLNNQIKKTGVIKMKDKELLLILANNDSLKIYSFKN